MEDAKRCYEREHVQFNSQDLQQEQNVHMDPVQLSTQNVQIVIAREDNSSVITGSTYKERNKDAAKGVGILLFFGYEGSVPVYRTKSDEMGNFKIENLPPGFYTITAHYNEYPVKKQYIKLLPGQTLHQIIAL